MWKEGNSGADSDIQGEAPQLVVQQFSMEALHHTMLKNKNQILALYDEMSVMYSQLDAYKHSGSRLDRSTLLDLYNGGSWSRNFKNKDNSTIKMQQTCFNMCGFIQPSFVVKMLESTDPDAFNDRQFFICPEEVEYKYNELKLPMDFTVANLEDIFRALKRAHENKVTYTFDQLAMENFIKFHDELSDRKLSIKDDEDRRGILSKAKGQLARLAMVVHAIDRAVKILALEVTGWSSTIEVDSLNTAKTIMDYILDQKFALMLPEIKIAAEPSFLPDKSIISGVQVLDSNPKHLTKFLTYKGEELSASDVSRFRLMPPTPTRGKNKYPVDQCRSFMRSVSEGGFGSVDESIKEGSSKKSFHFRKRPFSELGENQQETLKKLLITQTDYDAYRSSTPGSSSTR